MTLIAISALSVALAAASAWLVVLVLRGRRAERRFEILGEIATVSEGARSLEETFSAICDVLVPELADFCMIDLFEEGQAQRVAVAVGDGAEAGFERRLRERKPSLPEPMIAGEGGEALRPRFMERVGARELQVLAHDDGPDLEFLQRTGLRSVITVPLQTRRQVKGALTLVAAWSGRAYSADDAHFAWILAGRIALALDNSGLFADLERAEWARAEIAQTLQHGLLPPALPYIPGWSLAAMYRPAGAENEVGGDFYDAFRVPGGWMLVIGDVTGRGAEAASITALARYTLRTAAMLTNDPQVALTTLNRALLGRNGTALCSVAAVAIGEDPAEPVWLAVAGHPPPLLVHGEQVVEAAEGNPVLGAFDDVRWRIGQVRMEKGQQLVMVTDGVTEAAGAAGRFGEERLRAELAGTANPALAVQRLEGALSSFSEEALEDDAAVLVVARSASDRPHVGARALEKMVGGAGGWEAPADESHEVLIERLFNAFNRRDAEAIVALCSDEMEFVAVTGEEVGRGNPYRGPVGLREYLADVERVWEELLITAGTVESWGERLLVCGRVYLRSRELGIRDLAAAWIWQMEDGLFVRGEVFANPAQAIAHFDRAAA